MKNADLLSEFMNSRLQLLFAAQLITVVLLSCTQLSGQQLAFPGAEGFGAYSKGGRGGDVYHVINLNDSGEGSLRYGIENASSPRTIVFDLSGTIYLKSKLKIENPFITIAGQTAPGEGITLAKKPLQVYADHIIIRYIRVRLGDLGNDDDDAISINAGKHILLDHVTASWSIDETLSCQSDEVDSLTVQWSLISESLRNSHHEKGAHGYGGIIGSLRQSFHHNLYAHHSSRSPKVTWRQHTEVDFRNNVIYNWGYQNCYDGTTSYINWVNNYYKSGPGTEEGVKYRIFELSDEDIGDFEYFETSMYAEGNYVVGFDDISNDNWNGGIDFSNGASEAKNRKDVPFAFAPVETKSALDAYPLVLAGAGASFVRDVIDQRIVHEVNTGTAALGNNGIIDSQEDVGSWPELYTLSAPLDTDQDGMPDAWEIENGLDENDSADRNDDVDGDGYTNLEEYLYTMQPPSPTFELTVIDGSGSARVAEGTTVEIIANEALTGYYFDQWIGDVEYLLDSKAANTTLTMPAHPVKISSKFLPKITAIGGLDDNKFNCYPNPNNGQFDIDLKYWGTSDIYILSSIGQVVYYAKAGRAIHEVVKNDLTEGIYLVKVKERDSQKLGTHKVMIKKEK